MKRLFAALLAAVLLATAVPALAGMSKGQTVYVPCNSHVYHGVKSRPFDLTVTLTVRNTDMRRPITILSVDYYGTDGRLVRRMIDRVATLAPLAASDFIVEQNDTAGGVAASFIVRWKSDAAVNEPVAEAVMIGTSNSQGISFTSRGVAIQE